MSREIYMGKCPKLTFDPCKRTHVRGRCDVNTNHVLRKEECGNIRINGSVLFAKFDGVLYAVYEQSKAYAQIIFQHVQAEAFFYHMDESEILKQHHELALRLLDKMPTEQADMFRNITDNKVYGTIKYEDFHNGLTR